MDTPVPIALGSGSRELCFGVIELTPHLIELNPILTELIAIGFVNSELKKINSLTDRINSPNDLKTSTYVDGPTKNHRINFRTSIKSTIFRKIQD